MLNIKTSILGVKYNVDIVNKTSFKEVENIQVHVTLHGGKGDSGKRVLIKSTEEKEKLFQEGTVSKFLFPENQ